MMIRSIELMIHWVVLVEKVFVEDGMNELERKGNRDSVFSF